MRTLERLTVTGYKSIKELRDFELRDLNILIGANGAGKSNFVSLFNFLESISIERLQLYVGKNGRADFFLHFGRKVTGEIKINLDFKENGADNSYGYDVKFVPSVDGAMVFAAEEVRYIYSDGRRVQVMNLGSGHNETGLTKISPQEDVWSPKVLRSLKQIKTYHFQDTSSASNIKQNVSLYDNDFLASDAKNLASLLLLLQTKYLSHYKNIVDTIRLVAPFFDDFVLRPDNLSEDTIRLKWHHQESKYTFDVSQLSDGTLRFICLTTLLLQPDPPSLIIIDEPELGLHPAAITILAEMLRSAAVKTQVIVATQSVSLVNQFYPEDIIVIDQKDNQSQFRRVSMTELENWLGEYSMGELWEMNVIGGRP